jgi:hypothetical protein
VPRDAVWTAKTVPRDVEYVGTNMLTLSTFVRQCRTSIASEFTRGR